MIIDIKNIGGNAAYRGVDFLDTLEAELSIQKSELYSEFEQDKSVMQDRIKDTEALFLEAGKNNKTLLQKEEQYQKTIKEITEHEKLLVADIEQYKQQISNLEEAVKLTSFKPATEVPSPQTQTHRKVLPTMRILRHVMEAYSKKQQSVIIDDNGIMLMTI